MIRNVSPIDGRYKSKTKELEDYFSEYALIKYRIHVEIEYFIKLINALKPSGHALSDDEIRTLRNVHSDFNDDHAQRVKEIEKVTNHDVKAVEYFIKEQLKESSLAPLLEFIHFGLTSQDINNTALPMMIQSALKEIMLPNVRKVIDTLNEKVIEYKDVPMLARTHGQPASPTGMGKEFMVFLERMEHQIKSLEEIDIKAKFGGATGNFNAHLATYPDEDWVAFGNSFVNDLGLNRSQYTTQIAHYDSLAEVFHAISRINTILIDMARDIWTYISMNYFKQKVVANEVGSSAMPHKVNPIDFENAEGNLSLANAAFIYLAEKLPVSRLQRDLTDSTVSRNVGVPFAHSLIAYKSLLKGLGKLKIDREAIAQDLEENWAVVAEAIQNILRRENFTEPYEALKAFSRGRGALGRADFSAFIDGLEITDDLKNQLKQITPQNYVGNALDV